MTAARSIVHAAEWTIARASNVRVTAADAATAPVAQGFDRAPRKDR